jgi:alpha-methylacyl-CoA racemase
MTGALDGVRVVEMEGIGPGPHAAMLLADLGADVVRVARPDNADAVNIAKTAGTHTARGRRTVTADLKDAEQRDAVIALIDQADVLIEGMRPGVMERLGLGPEDRLAANPRLVYARMTGWGQTGPLAKAAGHDINYISLTGALHAIGPADRPVPPLNMVGDFGGGSMYLVTGILAALLERATSGQGQIIDVAMTDGASALLQPILELRAQDRWNDTRADNLLDGAAPFYRTYECSDGRFMAVGSVEPQFWARTVAALGLELADLPDQLDTSQWAQVSETVAAVFATKTRAEWTEVFSAIDSCVTPVLTFAEAPDHPHIAARRTLVAAGDTVAAAPAPRFSRSTSEWTTDPTGSVTDLAGALKEWTA